MCDIEKQYGISLLLLWCLSMIMWTRLLVCPQADNDDARDDDDDDDGDVDGDVDDDDDDAFADPVHFSGIFTMS